MRIGLDGTPVWGPPVGQYTLMVDLISAMLTMDTAHEFVVYCRRAIPDVFRTLGERATFHVCPFKNRKLCEQISIPHYTRRDPVDILHTCWCRPYLYRGKNVFNIMGLEWRTHPDVPLHSRFNNWYYKTTIETTCKKADRLIAISRFMKATFVERLAIPPDKIDVVHLGVNLDVYKRVEDQSRLDELKTRLSLPKRFMLFVGAMLANKNLERVIRSFHTLKHDSQLEDLGLVIAGGQGWNSGPIYALAEELGVKEDVVFTGFISQEDKIGLYSLATVYVFPSLVEGFGLPVLEAFACGAPVVTSNVTAMPEVAGDAALLVDPLSQNELTAAVRDVLCNDDLRATLVAKGKARAREFTWEEASRKMLNVYEKAYAG
ncbi:MAG: glycosyltransferase family 4 protein [Candidatus Thorarchaeota archaeon]